MKQLIEFAALNHIVDYHESRVFEFFCPHGVVVVLSLNWYHLLKPSCTGVCYSC